MRYLLDTDTLSFALRGAGGVDERLRETSPTDVGMSAITAAELSFGARVRKSTRLQRAVDQLLANVAVVPFDVDAARTFGRVAATLHGSGARVGIADELIAAQAITLGITLVTHNARHFSRVRELKTEDWFEGD